MDRRAMRIVLGWDAFELSTRGVSMDGTTSRKQWLLGCWGRSSRDFFLSWSQKMAWMIAVQGFKSRAIPESRWFSEVKSEKRLPFPKACLQFVVHRESDMSLYWVCFPNSFFLPFIVEVVILSLIWSELIVQMKPLDLPLGVVQMKF